MPVDAAGPFEPFSCVPNRAPFPQYLAAPPTPSRLSSSLTPAATGGADGLRAHGLALHEAGALHGHGGRERLRPHEEGRHDEGGLHGCWLAPAYVGILRVQGKGRGEARRGLAVMDAGSGRVRMGSTRAPVGSRVVREAPCGRAGGSRGAPRAPRGSDLLAARWAPKGNCTARRARVPPPAVVQTRAFQQAPRPAARALRPPDQCQGSVGAARGGFGGAEGGGIDPWGDRERQGEGRPPPPNVQCNKEQQQPRYSRRGNKDLHRNSFAMIIERGGGQRFRRARGGEQRG